MRGVYRGLVGCLLFSGCAVAHDVGDGSAVESAFPLSRACQAEIEDSVDGLPKRLSCTGLYKDTANKERNEGIDEFVPSHPLWSDASVKTRWVYLPRGSKIDAATATAWVFPAGTRFWKEFQNPAGNRRIETRVFSKNGDGEWNNTTYEWDADENDATRVDGGKDITVDGKPYHLPSHEQCNECHVGRRERVMGFDQVLLGLANPDAGGLTLASLLADNRLKNFAGPMEPQIGPDPGSVEGQALGWLHTNCGVSCHNSNSNSKAYSNGMRLMLDPKQLDGRPTDDFDPIKTTIGKDVFAMQWRGNKRIVAGSPKDSWLYKLITQRGDPKQQMPPLGTNEVDTAHTDVVKEWIASLPAN